ncbi:phage protein GemA/Gp16 family protein [Azonexus hydrophilus]|uniref:phage protein GemA/Gp16 family protein n=1 Tax=Azonexus hydrophilus TaxID=418702 RepID=UPI0024914CB0|nr:phage protein GemA/Gp16 family protein [Azonexus hydrophilus]
MYKVPRANLQKIALAICGRKGLGLTADQRHEIQMDVTGKASMSDMTLSELDDLVAHLRRLQQINTAPGAAATAGNTSEWRFVFRLAQERQIYAQKIYRLAQRIGKLQDPPVPVMSKAYIEGVTKQMRGTDQPLEFCDCVQLLRVIQALEVFVKRHDA